MVTAHAQKLKYSFFSKWNLIVEQLHVFVRWNFRRLLFPNENLSPEIVTLITVHMHKITFLFCSAFFPCDVFNVQ